MMEKDMIFVPHFPGQRKMCSTSAIFKVTTMFVEILYAFKKTIATRRAHLQEAAKQ